MLDRWRASGDTGALRGGIAACIAVHLAVDMERADDVPFGIFYALHFAPYFLLGLGANRFRSFFMQPRVSWTCLALLLVAMALHATNPSRRCAARSQRLATGSDDRCDGHSRDGAAVSAFRPLEIIGAYSFSIYLFHSFFVAAIRVASKQIEMLAVVFVACVIAGVVGPMVLERVLGKVPVVKTLLFGENALTGRYHRLSDRAAV